jgi:hypothetical protein
MLAVARRVLSEMPDQSLVVVEAFLVELSAYTPSDVALQSLRRPFWEVDAQVLDSGMPAGRDLSSKVLPADESNPSTAARSRRDGISYTAANSFLIPTVDPNSMTGCEFDPLRLYARGQATCIRRQAVGSPVYAELRRASSGPTVRGSCVHGLTLGTVLDAPTS